MPAGKRTPHQADTPEKCLHVTKPENEGCDLNMRIAISTSVIQHGRAGFTQYVLPLVKALLPHATQDEIYLLVLEKDLRLFDFVAGKMNLVPVPEKYRPPVRDIVWHQIVLPRLLKKLKIDVLHVPSYRRMLWSAPCALVATIHDLAQFRIAKKYDLLRMLYACRIAPYLAHSQDEIITISQSTAQDIERFFHISSERIHVIHHGVDSERFSPGNRVQAKAETASRWELEPPFFLYVSRIEHPAKNHVRLIEAFNQFRAASKTDHQLAFVGRDSFRSELVHVAAQASQFARDIRFLGFVEDADLATLYRSAEAMVYPSLFEGFGHPPIEAMSCGCPVLSSTRGSLAEVVGDSAGVFNPESIEEIVAALRRITTDLEWRDHLRAAGMVNARRFNWSKNAELVRDVYAKAFQRTKARREGYSEPVVA
jgi:glycosyltransferase involved in cell wall biosynthesis